MPSYTAPVEDMMFLFEKLRNNQKYNELDKYKEVTSDLVKDILQEAAKILLNLENRPSEKEIRKIAESWEPYRSVCAIILWHFYRNFKSRESTLW